MTAATRSIPAGSARSSAGNPGRILSPASAAPSSGTLNTRTGPPKSPRNATTASGSGPRADPLPGALGSRPVLGCEASPSGFSSSIHAAAPHFPVPEFHVSPVVPRRPRPRHGGRGPEGAGVAGLAGSAGAGGGSPVAGIHSRDGRGAGPRARAD